MNVPGETSLSDLYNMPASGTKRRRITKSGADEVLDEEGCEDDDAEEETQQHSAAPIFMHQKLNLRQLGSRMTGGKHWRQSCIVGQNAESPGPTGRSATNVRTALAICLPQLHCMSMMPILLRH